MSRSSALIVLGFLTMLVPFSGLPVSVRTVLLVIFGASAVGVGFSMRPGEQRASAERKEVPAETPAVAPEPAASPVEPPHIVSPI
jgi:hypothetical protein